MLKLLRMVGTTMRGPKPELLQCVCCCLHLISPVFSCLHSIQYYFGKGSSVIKGSVGGRSLEGYYVGRTLNKLLIFFLVLQRIYRQTQKERKYPVPHWAGISRVGNRYLPRCRTQAGGISEAAAESQKRQAQLARLDYQQSSPLMDRYWVEKVQEKGQEGRVLEGIGVDQPWYGLHKWYQSRGLFVAVLTCLMEAGKVLKILM